MMDHLIEYADKKAEYCIENTVISQRLYEEYGVNLGLRNEKGEGVLTGLTTISKIVSSKIVNGEKVSCDGELWYRGYMIEDLISSLGEDYGFEKIAYLLLIGNMPSETELREFCDVLADSRTLPNDFTRDVIMKASTEDIMSSMAKSILTLASYDEKAKDTSIPNVLRQSIQLIAVFPLLAVYGYNTYRHYDKNDSMFIHRPDPKLLTAENFLMMLRPDKKFSKTEAKVLTCQTINLKP